MTVIIIVRVKVETSVTDSVTVLHNDTARLAIRSPSPTSDRNFLPPDSHHLLRSGGNSLSFAFSDSFRLRPSLGFSDGVVVSSIPTTVVVVVVVFAVILIVVIVVVVVVVIVIVPVVAAQVEQVANVEEAVAIVCVSNIVVPVIVVVFIVIVIVVIVPIVTTKVV